jgi:hypothetical protein
MTGRPKTATPKPSAALTASANGFFCSMLNPLWFLNFFICPFTPKGPTLTGFEHLGCRTAYTRNR